MLVGNVIPVDTGISLLLYSGDSCTNGTSFGRIRRSDSECYILILNKYNNIDLSVNDLQFIISPHNCQELFFTMRVFENGFIVKILNK